MSSKTKKRTPKTVSLQCIRPHTFAGETRLTGRTYPYPAHVVDKMCDENYPTEGKGPLCRKSTKAKEAN